MATAKEAKLFEEEVLAGVGNAVGRLRAKLTGFLAMQGNYYNDDLMVVGRAVNGFRCGAFPRQLTGQTFRKRFAKNVLDSVNGHQGQCPMSWVTQKNITARSAFWRVIRQVTDHLRVRNRHQEDWPSYLVWSNLYKLSPWTGGNPVGRLRRIQSAGCRNLLQLEIRLYRPRRLLLLTGEGWAAPFLEALGPNNAEIDGYRYVERAGSLAVSDERQAYFVVIPHPQGRPEEPLAVEVLQAFQRLEHGP